MTFVQPSQKGPGPNRDPDERTDPDGPDGPPPSALPAGVTEFVGTSSRRTRILIAGAATVTLGAACLYTFLVDPNNPSNAYPQCPLKFATGIDCPGCGGLRATNALLHGDLIGAADHNIIALILLPIMAYMFVRWVLEQFDVTIPTVRWPRAFTWITPLVLVVFTVARNIPVPGLAWLNSGLA